MATAQNEQRSTPSEHEQQASLPDRLEKEHLLALLPNLGYEPVKDPNALSNNAHDIMPLYYKHSRIFLFPLSTDNPNNNLDLNGIAPNIDRVCRLDPNILTEKDLIVFPVLEEWNVLRTPRNSWVLVIYDNTTKFLYLIDPTGHGRPSYYENMGNLKSLEKAVTQKFSEKNIPITAKDKLLLQKKYLGIQDKSDHVSSGYWISSILYRLSQDERPLITLLENEFSPTTKQSIQQVRDTLLHVMYPVIVPDDSSDRDNHAQYSASIVNLVPTFEASNYGQEETGATPSSKTSSFLLSHQERRDPAPSSRFSLEVYSTLILGGTGLALFALICLSGTISVVPAAIATGVLGLGTVMFLGGVLGKCGVFRALSGSGPDGADTHTLQPGL